MLNVDGLCPSYEIVSGRRGRSIVLVLGAIIEGGADWAREGEEVLYFAGKQLVENFMISHFDFGIGWRQRRAPFKNKGVFLFVSFVFW